MSDEIERFTVEVDGKEVQVELRSRPFREGREVRVIIGDETHTLPEFGYGDMAVRERVAAYVRGLRK